MAFEVAGLIAAKALISLVFLANALGIVDQSQPVRDMEKVGVPTFFAQWATLGGRALQLVSCVALFTSFAQWGAAALAAFLVPATLLAHRFWGIPPQDRSRQLTQFLKNMAIIGGLVALAARP